MWRPIIDHPSPVWSVKGKNESLSGVRNANVSFCCCCLPISLSLVDLAIVLGLILVTGESVSESGRDRKQINVRKSAITVVRLSADYYSSKGVTCRRIMGYH